MRLFNLDSQTTISITNDFEQENYPDIGGEWVVWEKARDIFAYNIQTSEQLTITHDGFAQQYPRVDSNLVVWEDNRNGNWDIYGYDLERRVEQAVIVDAGDQYLPNPSGEFLVFGHCMSAPNGCDEVNELRALDLRRGQIHVVYQYESVDESIESSFAEHHRGNIIWERLAVNLDSQIRLAKRFDQQLYLPIVAGMKD